jgi:hypothetical protein
VTSCAPLENKRLRRSNAGQRILALVSPSAPGTPAGGTLAYVEFAPPALIRLFERRGFDDTFSLNAERPLLDRLLHDRKMVRPWKIIRKYLKTDAAHEDLWKHIIRALHQARKGSVRRTDPRKLGAVTKAKKERYLTIAEKAEQLRGLIEQPETMPLDGTTPVYDGELDLPAFNFFPDDVQKSLSAVHEWSSSLRPALVELLQQLARMARQQANASPSIVRRDRGKAYEAIFTRELYRYLIRANMSFKSEFAVITRITNVVMSVRWDRQTREAPHKEIGPPPKPKALTTKNVRAMICGTSGKLPIKTRRNRMRNE